MHRYGPDAHRSSGGRFSSLRGWARQARGRGRPAREVITDLIQAVANSSLRVRRPLPTAAFPRARSPRPTPRVEGEGPASCHSRRQPPRRMRNAPPGNGGTRVSLPGSCHPGPPAGTSEWRHNRGRADAPGRAAPGGVVMPRRRRMIPVPHEPHEPVDELAFQDDAIAQFRQPLAPWPAEDAEAEVPASADTTSPREEAEA